MWNDPIVEEIRAIRDSYAKQFDYNLDAIFHDLQDQQAKSKLKFISLPPKRIKTKNTSEQLNENTINRLTTA